MDEWVDGQMVEWMSDFCRAEGSVLLLLKFPGHCKKCLKPRVPYCFSTLSHYGILTKLHTRKNRVTSQIKPPLKRYALFQM